MRIDTARLNTMINVDSLSPRQREAVVKLRKKAEAERVFVYTLGAFCSRASNLHRISDARRLVMLTPASREFKIAEIRELVHPFDPSVVAIWSVWCSKNGIDPKTGEMIAPEKVADAMIEKMTAPEQLAIPIEVAGRVRRTRNNQANAQLRARIMELFGDKSEIRAPARLLVQEGFGRALQHKVRNELGITSTYTGERQPVWRLPTTIARIPDRHTQSMRRAMETLARDLAKGIVPVGSTRGNDPESKRLRQYARERMAAMAERLGVRPTTLADWAEMNRSNPGTGSPRNKVVLPDRESDEGIELADEVFITCMPLSPSVAAVPLRKRR
jgi:hypothetical protein